MPGPQPRSLSPSPSTTVATGENLRERPTSAQFHRTPAAAAARNGKADRGRDAAMPPTQICLNLVLNHRFTDILISPFESTN
jgi:hypothetical protein